MATKRKVPEGMKRVQATITMLVSEKYEEWDTGTMRKTSHASLARELRERVPDATVFGAINSITSLSLVELDEPNYSTKKKGAKK